MIAAPAFSCRFEFTADDRAVIVELVGKLDPTAVEDLHPQVQEVYQAGVRRFVFDLSQMSYTGSLGIRLFLGLQNQLKGIGLLALCAPVPAVRGIFQMMKLTEILPIYPTREAALEAVHVPV
jgi:anti-sigma B factor antagonist